MFGDRGGIDEPRGWAHVRNAREGATEWLVTVACETVLKRAVARRGGGLDVDASRSRPRGGFPPPRLFRLFVARRTHDTRWRK